MSIYELCLTVFYVSNEYNFRLSCQARLFHAPQTTFGRVLRSLGNFFPNVAYPKLTRGTQTVSIQNITCQSHPESLSGLHPAPRWKSQNALRSIYWIMVFISTRTVKWLNIISKTHVSFNAWFLNDTLRIGYHLYKLKHWKSEIHGGKQSISMVTTMPTDSRAPELGNEYYDRFKGTINTTPTQIANVNHDSVEGIHTIDYPWEVVI